MNRIKLSVNGSRLFLFSLSSSSKYVVQIFIGDSSSKVRLKMFLRGHTRNDVLNKQQTRKIAFRVEVVSFIKNGHSF